MSRWLAVAFAPSVIFSTVFAPQGIGGAVMGLPLIVVMILLASRIARTEMTEDVPAESALQQPYVATTH